MLNINPDLEQKLQIIAARSGRSIDELATDVLTDYANEVADLEATLDRDGSAEPAQQAAQLVYLRRRHNDRHQ